MKFRWIGGIFCLVALLLAGAAFAADSMVRITLRDGNTVEVPYYWEKDGEIRFHRAGGEAGIPRSDVASIQEIVPAAEYDPEMLAKGSKISSGPVKLLKELVAAKIPPERGQQMTQEEVDALLTSGRVRGENYKQPEFSLQTREIKGYREGGEVRIVIEDILKSRAPLGNRRFFITLYNGNGAVLERAPAETIEIKDLEVAERKNIGMRKGDHLYVVRAVAR
ncbi:MAG: hypothetical protein ACLGPL_09730, partial [Acidobacteriota bacterium]